MTRPHTAESTVEMIRGMVMLCQIAVFVSERGLLQAK